MVHRVMRIRPIKRTWEQKKSTIRKEDKVREKTMGGINEGKEGNK